MNDPEALAWLNNAMQEAMAEALSPMAGKPIDPAIVRDAVIDAASKALHASLEELIQVVPRNQVQGERIVEFDLVMPQWLAVQIGLEKGQ